MRATAERVALGAVALVVMMALLPAPGADAAEETTASLRAKRQVLVQRIAALTDQTARANQLAESAARAQEVSQVELDVARRRVAGYAVDAYLDGVQDGEDSQLRLRVWADALAEPEREVLGFYRATKAQAVKDAAIAATARSESKKLAAELEAARATLERTIADRVRYERAAASKAARRPAGSVPGASGSRHARATMGQGDLMRTYQFGPASGVPAGLVATGEVFEGRASWYGPGFDGRATASGAIFDQEGWTVAHRTLPLGTILMISHGGRSVVVLVNDRGPFVGGRILDLSHGVANYLGTVGAGVAPVRAEVLAPL